MQAKAARFPVVEEVMRRDGWAVRGLVPMALAASGCVSRPNHPPLPVDLSEEPVSPCDVAQRARATCTQLEQTELKSSKRGLLNIRIEDCRSAGGTRFVSWPPAAPDAPVHSMAVEFRAPRGNGPLVPIRLDPIAMQWPCVEHCEQETLVAQVPVLDPCDAQARLERRSLTLPEMTATSCRGAALRSGAPADFCREPVARGATIYRIATRAAFADLWEEVRIELREGESFADVAIRKEQGPVERGVVEAPVWEERLGAVWGMPLEENESCYEEGFERVTAVREGAWRVVVRRCSSVIDLHDLVLTTSRMGAAP
jgi:hypothetical protein